LDTVATPVRPRRRRARFGRRRRALRMICRRKLSRLHAGALGTRPRVGPIVGAEAVASDYRACPGAGWPTGPHPPSLPRATSTYRPRGSEVAQPSSRATCQGRPPSRPVRRRLRRDRRLGEVIAENGVPTSARPGKLIRAGSSARRVTRVRTAGARWTGPLLVCAHERGPSHESPALYVDYAAAALHPTRLHSRHPTRRAPSVSPPAGGRPRGVAA